MSITQIKRLISIHFAALLLLAFVTDAMSQDTGALPKDSDALSQDDSAEKSKYPITVNVAGSFSKMAISDNGKLVAIADYSTLYLYDATTGEQLQVQKSKSSGSANYFAFARDNKHLIVSGSAGTFVVKIDAEDDYLLTISKFDVECNDKKNGATAAQKSLALIADRSHNLHLIDYQDEKVVKTIALKDLVDSIKSVHLSANGTQALISTPKAVVLIDLNKGEAIQRVEVGGYLSYGATFNPDGTRFFFYDSSAITLFETKTGRQKKAAGRGSSNYAFIGPQQLIFDTQSEQMLFYQPGTMKKVATMKFKSYHRDTATSDVSSLFVYQTDSKQFVIDRVPVMK